MTGGWQREVYKRNTTAVKVTFYGVICHKPHNTPIRPLQLLAAPESMRIAEDLSGVMLQGRARYKRTPLKVSVRESGEVDLCMEIRPG